MRLASGHGTRTARRLTTPRLGLALCVFVLLAAAWRLPIAHCRLERDDSIRSGSSNRQPSPRSGPIVNQQSQALLTAADEVFREVSSITGLPIKAPLKKEVVDHDQMSQYLIASLRADYSPREIHAQEAMLKAFGLVAPDFDLEKFLITFYTEQAAGVYDPRRKTMLIAAWVDQDTQKVVLAHELTHALQDQSYDLRKFLQDRRDDDDATAARQAIAEGHATAAMMQTMVAPQKLEDLPTVVPLMSMNMEMQIEQYPVFSSAPFFFRYQALFPYAQGARLMQRGLKQGGWQKLRDFFLHPPETTKEIFEPDFYFEHQRLPEVALPDPRPMQHHQRLRVVERNRMGQLGYYCLLGQLLSEEEAKKVAPSWLADRYLVYEDSAGHRYAVVARVRWAGAEAAAGFFRDLHTILVKKYPDMGTMRAVPSPAPLGESGSSAGAAAVVGSTSVGTVVVVRRGDEVLWAEGVPSAQLEAMLDYLRSL